MTDHTRLRELAQNATPGPWVIDWAADIEHDEDHGLPAAIIHPIDVARQVYIVDDENGQALNATNAEFIAAANPQTVLALLDELATAKADAPRIITTAEELDRLPNESIIRTRFGCAAQKDTESEHPKGDWFLVGILQPCRFVPLDFPATVLYAPKEG